MWIKKTNFLHTECLAKNAILFIFWSQFNFFLNDATPRITIKNNLAIKYSGPMDSRGVYSILTKDKRPAVTRGVKARSSHPRGSRVSISHQYPRLVVRGTCN